FSSGVIFTSATRRVPVYPISLRRRTSCRIASSFNCEKSAVNDGWVTAAAPTNFSRAHARASVTEYFNIFAPSLFSACNVGYGQFAAHAYGAGTVVQHLSDNDVLEARARGFIDPNSIRGVDGRLRT